MKHVYTIETDEEYEARIFANAKKANLEAYAFDIEMRNIMKHGRAGFDADTMEKVWDIWNEYKHFIIVEE